MKGQNYWQQLRRKRLSRRRLLQGSGLAVAGLAGYALVGCEEEEEAAPTATETAAPTGTPEAATPTAPPAGPQVLRMPSWEPGQIGPSDDYGFGAIFVDHIAYSGPWGYDENRGLVDHDAAAYESPDGVTHIVTLKPDLKWSDGTPYNAREYEFTYTESVLTYGLGVSSGVIDQESDWLRVPDDFTLEITTRGPVPEDLFKELLGGNPTGAYPVPRHKWQQFGREYSVQPVDQLVFNGPYKLESWDHNQRMVLVRNPEWRGFPANLDRIEATIFAEAQSTEAMSAFEAGELDIAPVPLNDLRRVLDDLTLSANAAKTDWGYMELILLNTLAPGLNDIRVREALYGAVDRQLIVDTILAGLAVPLYGTLPPVMPGYDPEARPFPDASVENSRKLLEAAGFPNGEGLPTYRFVTTTTNQPIIEAVAQMWKENLGVNSEVRPFDTGSYFADVIFSPVGTDWGDLGDAFWITYYNDYFDVTALTAGFVYKHGAPVTDEIVAKERESLFEADPETRIEKLKAWDVGLTKLLWWVPLYAPTQLMVRRPGISGDFFFYGMDFQRLRYMRVGSA